MRKIFIALLFLSFITQAQKSKSPLLENKPLYVVDGKVVPDITSINPSEIQKVDVLKGKEAIDKYGEGAKYGVIKISTGAFLKRELIDPKATQIWEMAPQVISAGKNSGDAPSDAIVLFDGKDLSNWTDGSGGDGKWDVKDGAVTVVPGKGAIKTKKTFDDVQLHIEWRTPAEVKGDGQNRGNSGIFFQEEYELQVLDSYENPTYSNGQAGSIYKEHIPLVNVSRKPGEWQTYDVVYTAPRFNEKGRVVTPGYITVFQNGVVVQNHVQITGPTENQGLPLYKPHGKRSIVLQDHDTPVSYRNIWVREL
ncbi:MAG: DUF1080 domain-containing protein [Cyclobacteriaceae bacterium]